MSTSTTVDKSEAMLAADTVAYYVHKHGHGPTWRELGELMDWGDREAVDHRVRQLAREGWLTFTRKRYSLRPGPRHGDAQRNAEGGAGQIL